ncbi:hypothetical protein, partial [Roseovarius aestuariivivens]|uniref:hypothetical protein n=1 Tax=Roseovarius aestuariivivens TaxID=1888910 RepID=UPI001AEC518A
MIAEIKKIIISQRFKLIYCLRTKKAIAPTSSATQTCLSDNVRFEPIFLRVLGCLAWQLSDRDAPIFGNPGRLSRAS